MPKEKSSAEAAAMAPDLRKPTFSTAETAKAGKTAVEPLQPDLDDDEELVEDGDDVSDEIEEEVEEEELGLDSPDDDVDYLEKSEDLLDDTDEYRNN